MRKPEVGAANRSNQHRCCTHRRSRNRSSAAIHYPSRISVQAISLGGQRLIECMIKKKNFSFDRSIWECVQLLPAINHNNLGRQPFRGRCHAATKSG